MPDIDDARRFAAGLDELVRRARADLDTVWGRLDLSDYKEAERVLAAATQALTDRHGAIGAAVAADWYDDLRGEAGVAGRFTALAQEGPPPGQIAKIAHYAANQGLWRQNPDGTLTYLDMALDRLVKQAARRTIDESVRHDPAKPRYARVPCGPAPCAFCRMLASRGYVYYTAGTAGDNWTSFHRGNCHCVPVPQWGPGSIGGYDYKPYLRQYEAAGGDLARMRKGTPENASHYKPKLKSGTQTGSGGGGGKLPPVPSILLGGSADWPDWLDPISANKWQHVIDQHGPRSTVGKPRFLPDTDIGNAIFDTITKGTLHLDGKSKKQWRLVVNGQEIVVDAVRGGSGWFISGAYPNE